MKKTLCALAVGATLFSPAIAMAADVKVYGRAHVSVDYLDDGENYSEVGLSSNSSRLGFKAEQELENGMTIFGQVEQQINFASGSKDADSVDFSTRDTFVGLKGDFGQVKLGRFDTPFKAARGPVNFFGDQVGDLRNLTRAGDHRFDERNDNTIEYQSPKFGPGFKLAAALSMHAGTTIPKNETTGDGQDNDKAYDVALTYKEGPIDFAIAYAHFDANAANARAASDRDAIRVAGAYKLTEALNVGAFFQAGQIDIDDTKDANVYGVAADYKLTPKTYLRGQVFQRDVDADDSNSTLLALGVEHRLDPAVRVYANLATVLNDEKAKLTPWAQARSNNIDGATGEDATGLSVGLRYDF